MLAAMFKLLFCFKMYGQSFFNMFGSLLFGQMDKYVFRIKVVMLFVRCMLVCVCVCVSIDTSVEYVFNEVKIQDTMMGG